jgi:hypothetical protein
MSELPILPNHLAILGMTPFRAFRVRSACNHLAILGMTPFRLN